VPPPVDTTFYQPDSRHPDPYFLVVSALVPYKRLELAIDACREADVPLRIVGEGTERAKLEATAGPGVEFLGRLTDELVREQYRSATAVLLPGEEDFGIVPVEAQACGRPVIARAKGGALETVVDGRTGVLVDSDNPACWADAIRRVRAAVADGHGFAPSACRTNAERFSRERFLMAFQSEVRSLVDAPPEAARW
jgi:glycosyltransferase involved in cell wall biosynthesis